MGLLKPVSGDLLINNFKISENFDSNFRFISYVSQNNLLLDDTVINNITLCYQNKHVNWDKLNNAIDMAQLRNTINKYPDGLNQIVGEIGRNISGGEIQRIAIARSLYMNSSVLILDEPTSALDTETENNILDLIIKLKNNKTIILITHNLKLISKCNKIYKIDNGYCKEDNCI
jgi:ABC-type bacteriocin/lantibiotic exporter with double-glycine peptidase domain